MSMQELSIAKYNHFLKQETLRVPVWFCLVTIYLYQQITAFFFILSASYARTYGTDLQSDNIISLLETYTFWLARLDLMNLIVMFIDISML